MKRNVIMVLSDSLRVDHLGCYGNQWIKTPNIDRLASEGTVFENAYSEGLPTLPFRTSVFTGRFTLPFRGWQRLEPTDVLLSEVLWNKGYNSAIVSDCYHLHEPPYNNYGRGFRNVSWIRGQEHDPYVTDPSTKIDPQNYFPVWEYSEYEKKRYRLFEQYLKNTVHWVEEKDSFTGQVCGTACNWLESSGSGERFFLWVDFFDPHAPYDPRFPPYDNMYDAGWKGKKILWIEGMAADFPEDAIRQMRANYAGEVTFVDKWIGILMKKIEDLGLLDDTLIMFFSDHGEPLGEHGIITKMRPWPYEELSHIPLIIRHPENLGKGKRIESFAQSPDISATALDFMKIKMPHTFQGKSLLPVISGENEKNYDLAISGFYNRSWSIRNKEWSYYLWIPKSGQKRSWSGWFFEYSDQTRLSELYILEGSVSAPRPEDYRVEKNVYEDSNVVEENPEIAKEMELKLRRVMDNLAM